MPAKPQKTEPRQPVVVVMGHIDHGKSTLLDFIRKTNIVAKEAGGITQHIGAYVAIHEDKEGKKHPLTFLDTPGHEAFGGIRSRGAKVADVAILVVSAEDGVKPQTVEALRAITEAKIPYIVAINKIDKPNADLERTKQSLAEHEIYIEGYGGTVPFVPISAKTGAGISELLDLVVLSAELQGLTGSPEKLAEGVVIEVNHDNRRGTTATVIIKDGVLKKGNAVVAEGAFSVLRQMENSAGTMINEARFGEPVRIIGWEGTPAVGALVTAKATKKEAEAAAAQFEEKKAAKTDIADGPGIAVIPVVIKADVAGTLEAIAHELKKVQKETVLVRTIYAGLGSVGEGDVKTAHGSPGTIILGFNVKVDATAAAAAERLGIQIQLFDIIYKLSEWLTAHINEKTPKVEVEEMTGRAKVLKTFSRTKDKQIVGGRVEDGLIALGATIKILRRDAEIGRGKIRELQQQKANVSDVKSGTEFGAMVESKIEIAAGDRLESFVTVTK